MKKKLQSSLLILLLGLPLLLPVFIENQYYVHGLFCRIIIYSILVASLDLVVGFIGDISIGHAGLFAIGSYSVAILTAPHALNTEATMTFMPEWPFFIALFIGVSLSALAGLILGFPSLRSSGPYLAVTTIAYGMIIFAFINEQELLTNGTKGIHVRAVTAFGQTLNGNKFVWLVYPFLMLVLWIMHNFKRSYWGRAFEAIKYSSIAAEACGIYRNYFKIAAFVISAGIAGLAGGLFTQLDQYIAASTFNLDFSILALIALIFGGLRSTLGNVIGMTLVVVLPDLFTSFKDYRLLVFGVLLLMTLFFLPKGVVGLLQGGWKKVRGFKSSAHEFEVQLAELRAAALKDNSPLFKTQKKKLRSKFRTDPAENPLTFKNVSMQFGGLVAVGDLSIDLKPGMIRGLMGPNGSGKSTTVNLITGLYTPTSGDVFLFGKPAKKLRPFDRAKMGVARTFQNLQLFSELSVLDNVMVGLHLSFRANLLDVVLGLPKVWKEERNLQVRAFRMLQFVGLESMAFEPAKNLSYGQARRLEIARALALDPQFLLLDEPAAGLTGGEIQEFNGMIQKMKEHGITILLIEHHMDMLMKVSDEITVLDFGRKIFEGPPSEAQKNPQVIKAYLGTESALMP
jgi:branched-chain amino acid transport system permease protein